MSSLLNLTVSQLRRAAELKEKIDALNSELSALLGGDDAPSARSTSGPKVKRNGKVTVGSAILEALEANGGVMDKTALLKAATALKGSKINEGSFNGEVQKLKGSGAVKSPGRGQFQIGTVAASAVVSKDSTSESKPKRTMSPAARKKIADAATARWAKARAEKEAKAAKK